jgi:hypothetical protein
VLRIHWSLRLDALSWLVALAGAALAQTPRIYRLLYLVTLRLLSFS